VGSITVSALSRGGVDDVETVDVVEDDDDDEDDDVEESGSVVVVVVGSPVVGGVVIGAVVTGAVVTGAVVGGDVVTTGVVGVSCANTAGVATSPNTVAMLNAAADRRRTERAITGVRRGGEAWEMVRGTAVLGNGWAQE